MYEKYRLTDEIIDLGGHTLHRIQALRDFGNVKAGDLGGFVENESNLSHEGDCWVRDSGWIYDNARISLNVQVSNSASVFRNAFVSGNVQISGSALVFGNIVILGEVQISSNTRIFPRAEFPDLLKVLTLTKVNADSHSFNKHLVTDNALVQVF